MGLKVIFGDITKYECDAVVNSSNRSLIGYSGVDRIIHELGGEELDRACASLVGTLTLGEAVTTPAYNMPCKYLIHIASLYWQGGFEGESAIQRSCYRKALEEAEMLGCKSVAFPLIGAGSNGIPITLAFENAITVISEFLTLYSDMDVSLVLHEGVKRAIFESVIEDLDTFIEADIKLSQRPEKSDDSSFISLDEAVENVGESFAILLCKFIDERGLKDSQVYKAAGIPKGTFNKIKNGDTQRPSIETISALAMALKLSYEETLELLASCGMTFSSSSKFDKIIAWFIKNQNYDIWQLDIQLLKNGFKPLLGDE